MTLYDELGGAGAVAAVVDRFYENVLGDPELVGYFGETDMGRLKAHQRAFVTTALGGPGGYGGRGMRQAHAGREITGEAFDAVVGHLATALVDCGATLDQVSRVAELLAPLRSDIVQASAVVS